MNAPQFQRNKVARLINIMGEPFEFKRLGVNEYGEPEDVVSTVTVQGVYHESANLAYIQKTSADSSTIRRKLGPMVLMLSEEAQKLNHKDVLEYKGKTYRVTGIHDFTESQVAAEVSLEEVQDG